MSRGCQFVLVTKIAPVSTHTKPFVQGNVKMASRCACLVLLGLCLQDPVQGFLTAPSLFGSAPTLRSQNNGIGALKMGFFDAIGKALSESMANDDSLGKQVNPGFREGYEGPSKVTVKFVNSGFVVESYGGERLGDVARRAGEGIQYGCQKGTCGTCEVTLTTPSGTAPVRCCEGIIPKHDLDYIPEYEIVVPDPNVALKRKLDWDQVKGASR